MLRSLAQAMGSGITEKGWLMNALLESFVVHVRVVLDFFYNDTPRNDDVVAQDFFAPSDAWASLRPKFSELLSNARKRAGKEMAHLTYARLEVTPETKLWPFVAIANEVASVMRVFLENVPREKLSLAVRSRRPPADAPKQPK